MPKVEKHSAIEFREYPSSRSILLRGHRGPEWGVDLEEEPRSYLPPWITQYQSTLPLPHTTFEGPGISHIISRELALAATRQVYLQRVEQGIWIDPVYESLQRKARLAWTQKRDATPNFILEASIAHANRECRTELRKLEEKVRFLEAQIKSQRPYLQLYRLGAGSLFVAVLSIVVWLITGIGIPFHPIFALGVIPAAIGVIVMAFLVRSAKKAER
jgi:hypothetical protein